MSACSASQTDTYLLCERKWGWRYLDGIKTEPHRSALVGTRVHEILEHWLTEGTPPDPTEILLIDGHQYFPGLIAESGLHSLPAPGPHLNVERGFRFGNWLGYVDLAYVSDAGTPVIVDHKTTTDLVWAQTPETLKTNVQAIVYANAALEEMPEAPWVDLCWNYYQTRKPYKNRPVHLRMYAEEAREAMKPFDVIAEKLIALKAGGARAIDMPVNPKACDAYGGCAHRMDCKLTPEQIMRSKMAREMSLEEKIAAAASANTMKMNGAAKLPPPMAPPPPAPTMETALQEGWRVHPESSEHAWNPTTNDVVSIETVRLVRAAPPPPPPAPVAPAPINPPEAPVEDKAEPSPEVPDAPQDELDAMDKGTLQTLALAEGVKSEAMKALREVGLKKLIRKERTIRAQHTKHGAPQAPAAPSAPIEAFVSAVETLAVGHAERRAVLEEGCATRHVVSIACALIAARERYEDDIDLARRAKSILDAIERVCAQ